MLLHYEKHVNRFLKARLTVLGGGVSAQLTPYKGVQDSPRREWKKVVLLT